MMTERQPPPDLRDLRGFHDYMTSVQDVEVWERLRLECGARAEEEPKPSAEHERQAEDAHTAAA